MSKIQEVKIYKTTDGYGFNSLAEAELHQSKIEPRKFKMQFGGYVNPSKPDWRPGRMSLITIKEDGFHFGTIHITPDEAKAFMEIKTFSLGVLRVNQSDYVKIGCTLGYWDQVTAMYTAWRNAFSK